VTARRLLGRVAFAVLAVYLVVSLTFAVVVYTPDSNLRGMLGTAAFSGASEEELREMRATYIDARGRDEPLLDRYVEWLVDVTLFRWGVSPTQERAVTAVVGEAVGRTAAYLLPGAALAWVVGTAVGLRSAARRGAVSDVVGRLASYALLGVPGFWLATLALATLGDGPTAPGDGLAWTVLAPAGVVATGLVAAQVSLVRSRSVDGFEADYARFLRAKGLSGLGVARRVFRNALVPVLESTAAELFSTLVLAVVVVETVFDVRGIGRLTVLAARENDIPLILGTTMVLVAVGVGGSLLADVASARLDPRSRTRSDATDGGTE
jgi:peptide/nickel transport system permease protein